MAAADGTSACFDLAAACCRWPADTRRDRAVIAAARDVTDWPAFLGLVRRHRVEALAHTALLAAGVALPADVATALRQRAAAIAQRNLAMAAETARLQAILDASDIRSLALKGAALAQRAYGSLAVKYSQDIDLLVDRDRAALAIERLERDGFRLLRPAATLDTRQWQLVMRYGREVALRRGDSNHHVELRWQAVDSPSLLAGVDASSPHQDIALGGVTLRTLLDDDLFAYLCVHGAGHGWSRLQWLADLNAFIATQDDAALSRLYRHAYDKRAGVCAALALLLCRRLLNRALPVDIERDLRFAFRARLAAALARDIMAGGDAEDIAARRFGTTRVALLQWLLGTKARHYASLIHELAFRMDDMLAFPLPRVLHFLYVLARPPVWLWRKVAVTPRRKENSEAGSA